MSSWLAEIAQAEGNRFRFDRFMELALYHPEHGYYTSHLAGIGAHGDFATAPSLGPLLGRAISRWLLGEAAFFGTRKLQIAELGGGNGDLAETILKSLPRWRPVTYSIVETSPLLAQVQKKRLQGKPVSWFGDVRGALEKNQGCGLVIANEFVDAFPCRRFRRVGAQWDELFFQIEDGQWTETVLPAAGLPSSSAFTAAPASAQEVEVHDAYRSWLEGFAQAIRQGALLTIDYGDRGPALFHAFPHGTVRAYFRHQRLRGPEIYLRAGRQDLTADVNFDDLRAWGTANQLETVEYESQAEFIRHWLPRRMRSTQVDRYLTDTAGAGHAFKVLHQRIKC